MPPCTCSIRAFELFVKNLSGLTLRASLSRPCVSSDQTRRRFSAIPRLRALEPAAAARINDDFVPFEPEIPRRDSTSKITSAKDAANKRRKAARADEEDLDDEWHAEIEIVTPWPQETISSSATDASAVEQEHAQLDDAHTEKLDGYTSPFYDGTVSINETSLQESDAEHGSVETTAQAPLSLSEPTLEPSFVQQRSRAENRQERKLRRLQAGTYRQEADKRSEEKLASSRLSLVLDKIKEMEGSNPEDSRARQGCNLDKAKESESEDEKKNSHGNATMKSLPRREADKKPKLEAIHGTATTSKAQVRTSREGWQVQKEALKAKFGEQGWQPRKRLSPDTLDGIRALHSSDPSSYTTETLAEHFKVTPEAIRRILKSKWRPNAEEAEKRLKRWEKRGERKWTAMAAQGTRPPAKWRAKGIRTPQAEKRRPSRRRGDEYVEWEDRTGTDKGKSLSERIL